MSSLFFLRAGHLRLSWEGPWHSMHRDHSIMVCCSNYLYATGFCKLSEKTTLDQLLKSCNSFCRTKYYNSNKPRPYRLQIYKNMYLQISSVYIEQFLSVKFLLSKTILYCHLHNNDWYNISAWNWFLHVERKILLA